MKDQLDTGDFGENLAGEIILGRPQAAAGQYQSRTARGNPEGRNIVFQVVGDRRMPADRDADFRQPLTEPLAVGIEVLTGGKLTADGDDFRFHEVQYNNFHTARHWPLDAVPFMT